MTCFVSKKMFINTTQDRPLTFTNSKQELTTKNTHAVK